MALSLPLDPEIEADDFTISLDGGVYRFRFTWNSRAQAWVMDVLTEAEEPIVSGVRVVVNFPILDQFEDSRLPPGKLIVVDTGGTGEEPGRNDLGARVQIVYFEAG